MRDPTRPRLPLPFKQTCKRIHLSRKQTARTKTTDEVPSRKQEAASSVPPSVSTKRNAQSYTTPLQTSVRLPCLELTSTRNAQLFSCKRNDRSSASCFCIVVSPVPTFVITVFLYGSHCTPMLVFDRTS